MNTTIRKRVARIAGQLAAPHGRVAALEGAQGVEYPARLWQGVNVVALGGTLAVNWLAEALPIYGQTTAQVSDRNHTYLTPAPYTFAVWGPIYLGMTAYAVYQALPQQQHNRRLQRIGPWFAVHCAANCAWLVLWHAEALAPSLLAIGGMLVPLAVINVRLLKTRAAATARERWLVDLPFSVYFSWITVATLINTVVVLNSYNRNAWGISSQNWAVGLLGAATALALGWSVSANDRAFGATFAWATTGIAIEHAATQPVARAAWLATGIMAAAVLLGALGRRKSAKRTRTG